MTPNSRGDETRRQLLDAAEREFLAHGFTGARIQRIAGHAGVSVGAVYNHHADKDGLYAAVVLRVEELLLEDYLRPALEASDPPWERVRMWCHAYVQFILDHPDRARLMAGATWWDAARPEELDRQIRDRIGELSRRLTAVFTELARDGELGHADPPTAARLIWSAMFGVCALNVRHPGLRLRPAELISFVDGALDLISGGRSSAATAAPEPGRQSES